MGRRAMCAGDRAAVMTAVDIAEWEELYNLDPWGPERGDFRNGILCNLLDACHRTQGKPAAPLEYMPWVKDLLGPPPQQDPETIWNIFESFANS